MVTEDSKSVKNVDTAGEKISGVKLRLAVDAGGPPHAMKVTKAGASERDGAVEVSRGCAPNLTKVEKVLCGGG